MVEIKEICQLRQFCEDIIHIRVCAGAEGMGNVAMWAKLVLSTKANKKLAFCICLHKYLYFYLNLYLYLYLYLYSI